DPDRRRVDRRGLEVRRDRVKLVLIYVLLLKAMVTTFSGTATLPVVRQDFVVRRALLTDRDLNMAFTAGRSGPGQNGVYVGSVGVVSFTRLDSVWVIVAAALLGLLSAALIH